MNTPLRRALDRLGKDHVHSVVHGMLATNQPILTEDRALDVMAYAALIDQALFDEEALIPGYAAQHLLARLSATGKATVTSGYDGLRMTMLGIHASSTGSAYGLLRDWQHRAKDRVAMGAQR